MVGWAVTGLLLGPVLVGLLGYCGLVRLSSLFFYLFHFLFCIFSFKI
jgi:hypothetical protein